MNQADYLAQLDEIRNERARLADRRTTLETELGEVNTQLTHLGEIIDHLEPLAGQREWFDDYSKLGFTDAVREVLKDKKDKVSAQDISKALDGGGFNLKNYTSPMQSIYKILSRLAEASPPEVIREKEDGNVFYRWKPALDYADQGITDEDIPF
jgi:hypothetical protein